MSACKLVTNLAAAHGLAALLALPASAQTAPETKEERICLFAAGAQLRVQQRLDPTGGRVRGLRAAELTSDDAPGLTYLVELDVVDVGIPVTYVLKCSLGHNLRPLRLVTVDHRVR